MRTTEDTHCDKGARPDESSSPSKTSVPGQWAETGRIPREAKIKSFGLGQEAKVAFAAGHGLGMPCRTSLSTGTRELGRTPLTLQEPGRQCL